MWAQGSALRGGASFCPWHGTQVSPCVSQDKEQAMLPALVLTAQSAVTDPVEVHACQPTHWFSRLLCCSTMRVRLELYFPVKRVVFMPPRACHSVPRFPAAVCDDQERLSASARWGRALCGVAPAAPPRLYNAPRPGAAGACPTSAAVPDPRSLWAQQAGSPRST